MRRLGVLLLLTAPIFAADPQVKVTVDRNRIYEGDSITLTVSVENGEDLPTVDISEVRDFKVISGPNQSTNVQWVNGKMTSSHALSWMLVPRRKGELAIPALTIQADGKTYQSRPISITVYERNQNIPSPGGAGFSLPAHAGRRPSHRRRAGE